MNRKIIVPLAGALALATAMDIGVTAASAAPMGIAPQATVAVPAQVTDVQYRYRRYGYHRGYRRGWGAPAVGAAVGLGVLGAAAAGAAAAPYYGGYGYGYPSGGYGYGGYGCSPGYNC